MRHVSTIVSALLALLMLLAGSSCPSEPLGPCTGLSQATLGDDADVAEPADVAAQPERGASSDGSEAPTEVGAPIPAVVLQDVQPDSCRFGQSYSLDAFRGRTVVVALLAAW